MTAPEPELNPNLLIENVYFFMIWTKSGSKPRHMHRNRASAEIEATRLALKHPGKKFIIFEAVAKFSVPAPALAPVEAPVEVAVEVAA